MLEKLANIDFHKKKIDEIVAMFDGSIEHGLTDDKVTRLAATYGLNQEDDDIEDSFIEKIKGQFEDRTVKLLLIAALVSFMVNMFCKISTDFSKRRQRRYSCLGRTSSHHRYSHLQRHGCHLSRQESRRSDC